jgi:hypothetical protein
MWSKDDVSQASYTPPAKESIFTADQARQAAENYHGVGGDLYNRVTLKIMKEIADAARRGGRALYITKFYNDLDYASQLAVSKHLESAGYEVDTLSDQRDCETSHKVVW